MPELNLLRSAPAGLKLTTAKFYSPLNRPYSEQGVLPDIPILSTARLVKPVIKCLGTCDKSDSPILFTSSDD